MKEENKILKMYKETGALQFGHFVLSSGLHSEVYLQSAKVLSIPKYLKTIATSLAVRIKKRIKISLIDLIVAPAMGGIVIGSKIGEELNKKSIFLERVNSQFSLRRGFEINKNDRVLIVEDVITTGKSSIECINCVEELGGKVLAVASIVDRSINEIKFEMKQISLIKIDAPIYSNKELPERLKKIPEKKPGSRFLK